MVRCAGRLRVECVCSFNQAKDCVADRLPPDQPDFKLFRFLVWPPTGSSTPTLTAREVKRSFVIRRCEFTHT